MPLHGKIVVIKRSGGDGTEFPLTATCLFGRKPDCDIRIQLPQVSKEHCRIDLNENKEVILTNLSSVNPTRVNGEALQQSERLKHGDVITVIDRSFRFEYPPAPTPKKRSSTGGKSETFKVLQDQQVGDSVTSEKGEKRISEVSTDPHLKDGTNHDNIQRSLEKTMEVESKLDESKTASPFNDLYQMIKKSLDVKTPRKSSASLLQTPTSRFCTPKPASVRKCDVISTGEKSTPVKDEAKVPPAADEVKMETENVTSETPKSDKKQRRSMKTPPSLATPGPEAENSETTSSQKRIRTPPQRFTVGDITEQTSGSPKSPMRRRSKEATSPKAESTKKASPGNSGTAEKVKSKKRKSGELPADLPKQKMKRKRVSFGGHLSPELFDKRLPPDSPLRKGADPRRSLSVLKPKQSLLRRASVIGLLKEFDQEESPAKKKTPSPKRSPSAKSASPKTPTSEKKSPKSRSPSPKAATPAKASPKTKSSSPKAATPAKASPKSKFASPKAATPAKGSPKSRSPSPKAATPKSKSPSTDKMKTPKSARHTPTVQGRFSVSLISTPSPLVEEAAAEVTPKQPLKRQSISRKTPKLTKSAVKIMARRSGISRASLKAKSSWADMVKFGQPKPQVVAPTKRAVIRKTQKKAAVPKPQTPARALPGHVSTGHACSPVTIVLSRAQRQKLVQPTGAAPRVVANIALLKKNMKMDEDLSGVSEMFKTPVNERKRKSVIGESSAMKTPMGGLETPLVEPSVLNTPEEPGEMMVSPLSGSSTVKDRQYNSEAVKRLLDGGEESSFSSDIPAVETHPDGSSEQECADTKTTSVSTPKQKPELPDCLTGVKRVMKTPKQKFEPIEDLRGRLLKTPKQKLEQQECLTGVKRIMRTPKQKAEPIEDLRGKILKTPKQKAEQPECLSGVKRIMQTPQQEAKPLEDLKVKLLETPSAPEAVDVVEELTEKAEPVQESEDVSEVEDVGCEGVQEVMEEQVTEQVEDQPPVDGGVEVAQELEFSLEETQKDAPSDVIEDVPQVDMEKEADVKDVVIEDLSEEALRGNANDESSDATEDVSEVAVEENQAEEQPTEDTVDETQSEEQPELEAAQNVTEMEETAEDPEPQAPVIESVPEVEEATCSITNIETTAEEHEPEEPVIESVQEVEEATCSVTEPEPTAEEPEPTAEEPEPTAEEPEPTAEEPEPQAPGTEIVPEVEEVTCSITEMEKTSEEPEAQAPVIESVPEVEEATSSVTEMEATAEEPEPQAPVIEIVPEVEEATCSVTEMETTAVDLVVEKKPVRGRRVKTVETKATVDKQETTEQTEEPVIPAPVRGRRGKKTEVSAAPAVRQATRGRNAKTTESTVEKSEPLLSEVATKPKRGRNAKKASDDQPENVDEVTTETEIVPEAEPSPPAEVDQEESVSAAPVEKAVVKPKRGRKAKQPEQAVPEQQDATCTPSEDVPPTDVEKDIQEVSKVCSEQPSDAEAPVSESLPVEETESSKDTEEDAAVVQKKPVRGRRAKTVESKVELTQEATEKSEEPTISAPVRGRRGRKIEASMPVVSRQTARGRNAKSQESTSDDQPEVVPEKSVETMPVTEVSTESVTEKASVKDTVQEEQDYIPPTEEAAVKPVRGRKAKVAPVEQPEPQTNNVPTEEQLAVEDEPQKSVPTVEKPKRGRKIRPDTVKQKAEAEDTVITVETKQPAQPPVRAKRGRNAKQEEEKHESDDTSTSAEISESQEPVIKVKRTRRAEQNPEEPKEVQPVETVVQDIVEAPVVEEPVTINEQPKAAAKPRRGGRKAKQDMETEEEIPSVSTTEKPKRGRRGKQVTEEAEVAAVVPEEKPEEKPVAEEMDNAEPEAPVIKPSRGRAQKTTVKSEVSQAVPAKRGRRGAAASQEETNTEASVMVSESVSVEPAKRGRRAAAKPTTEDAKETSKQETMEDTKVSKRSVKWKQDIEVIEISKVTPVKATRGRRPKLADPVDVESVSKEENKPEEEDLSETAVKAPPVKRARRGAKVADVADEAESTSKGESVVAETEPKTRRGRSAKK